MPFLDQRYQLLRTAFSLGPSQRVSGGVANAGKAAVIVADGGSTINLPAITPASQGRSYYIKRSGTIDVNPVTIQPDPNDFINYNSVQGAPLAIGAGASSQSVVQLVAFTDPTSGNNIWLVVSEFQLPYP